MSCCGCATLRLTLWGSHSATIGDVRPIQGDTEGYARRHENFCQNQRGRGAREDDIALIQRNDSAADDDGNDETPLYDVPA